MVVSTGLLADTTPWRQERHMASSKSIQKRILSIASPASLFRNDIKKGTAMVHDDLDGTINISDIPDAEYRETIRRLSDLYSSPCLYCQSNCTDWHICEDYQRWRRWMEEGVRIRAKQKR